MLTCGKGNKEYPRPELMRKDWVNLNGQWSFAYNFSEFDVAKADDSFFDKKIVVPFCPESELSGLKVCDSIINKCAYKRSFFVKKHNGKINLNFEAVNYDCKVYVNGVFVGGHKGGYTPFSVDVTDAVVVGENTLVVYCFSDVADLTQPSGKQSKKLNNYFVMYSRCTGIWQTVWLEYLPKVYVKNLVVKTYLDGRIKINVDLSVKGQEYVVSVFDGKDLVYENSFKKAQANFKLPSVKTWSAENPFLYRLNIRLKGTKNADKVQSYFGVREITIDGDKFLINGKKVFQRLVLDQGYYKDGVYTPKDYHQLKRDIILAKRWALTVQGFIKRFLNVGTYTLRINLAFTCGVNSQVGD